MKTPGFDRKSLSGEAIGRSMTLMTRLLHGLWHSLPSPDGFRLDRRLRLTNSRRVQFVSYLEASGSRSRRVDRYEQSLRRRRLLKVLLLGALFAGLAWVIIESAQAVTVF